MKHFNQWIAVVLLLSGILFLVVNLTMRPAHSGDKNRLYRVEAGRIVRDIEKNGLQNLDLSNYTTITAVVPLEGNKPDTHLENTDPTDSASSDIDTKDTDLSSEFFETESDYVIRQIGNTLYRIEYTPLAAQKNRNQLILINICLAIMSIVAIGTLFYIRQKIIRPFHELLDVPYELAKGNLSIPIKENKSRFFGKFIWGIDLLRENMEQQKQRELALQKEKKMLILSLSHDIKTPLSAIKLYAKALSKGLYSSHPSDLGEAQTKELQSEEVANRETTCNIARQIDRCANEIQGFVSEIMQASHEEFLNLNVNEGEFYLASLIDHVSAYYTEKLTLLRIGFSLGAYSNCLMKGDLDRCVETLQNIMENAIKYGDGHEITLSFAEEEDCQLITICNSGCTLAETELPHIFDSFWRGSNTGNESGNGLGLYICRQLLRKMDGDIFAEIADGEMRVTVVLRNA